MSVNIQKETTQTSHLERNTEPQLGKSGTIFSPLTFNHCSKSLL